MKAIVLGATGAVGLDLAEMLLKDDAFSEVEVFVRRAMPMESAKLTTHIVDFKQLNEWKDMIKGDVVFSCMGTTLKAAGSKERQYEIDYTYQLEFAKAAHSNGVAAYILVSSAMANSKSRLFYTRMKGELEDELEFRLLNSNGAITFRFSSQHLPTIIDFDFTHPFDPLYPPKVIVLDMDGKETILLPEENELF